MRDITTFNADGDYKAAINFRYGGRAVVKGDPIDKNAGDPRSLERLFDQRKIVPMSDEEVAAIGGPVDALTPEQQAKVDQLVTDNTRDQLNTLAAGEPYNIAEPDKLASKGDVATAIVRAEAEAA